MKFLRKKINDFPHWTPTLEKILLKEPITIIEKDKIITNDEGTAEALRYDFHSNIKATKQNLNVCEFLLTFTSKEDTLLRKSQTHFLFC